MYLEASQGQESQRRLEKICWWEKQLWKLLIHMLRARANRMGSSKAQTGGGWGYEQERVPRSEQDRWEHGQQAQIRTQEMGQAEAKAWSQMVTRIIHWRPHYPERRPNKITVTKHWCLLVCWAGLHFFIHELFILALVNMPSPPGKREWGQRRVHLGIMLRLASLSSHALWIFLLALGPLSRWPSVLCFCSLQKAGMIWGLYLNGFLFK